MNRKKIKVLIVEDSQVVRSFLSGILKTDERFELSGTAKDGFEALEYLKKNTPDIISMDINMPGIDGFETTKLIMKDYSIPVVIVSGYYSPNEVSKTIKATEVGAVAILPRPSGLGSPDYETSSRKFLSTLKLMSEIKVVRRNSSSPTKADRTIISPKSSFQTTDKTINNKIDIIAIGASAGGPPGLVDILMNIDDRIHVPIMIVQHIDAGFAEGFAEWLQTFTNRKVVIPKKDDILEPDHVYSAPGGYNMGVNRNFTITINNDPAISKNRPSVGFLFKTLSECVERSKLGIVLSGMGNDGSRELGLLKDQGNITIAQDKATCLVHGMPGEAIKLGNATYVLPPVEIARFINHLFQF